MRPTDAQSSQLEQLADIAHCGGLEVLVVQRQRLRAVLEHRSKLHRRSCAWRGVACDQSTVKHRPGHVRGGVCHGQRMARHCPAPALMRNTLPSKMPFAWASNQIVTLFHLKSGSRKANASGASARIEEAFRTQGDSRGRSQGWRAVSSSSAPVRWREQAWMECEVRGPLCEGESAPRGLGRRGQKLAEDSTRTPGPLAFVRKAEAPEKKKWTFA